MSVTQSTFDTVRTPPLCVELDCVVILSNSFYESLLALLLARPWSLLLLPFWMLRGRAQMKHKIAQAGLLDVDKLPYRRELVAFLEAQKSRGRMLVLATAANEKIARAVASHLGLFSGIVASDRGHDMQGRQKAAALVQLYGSRGFDYLGNSLADLPVWAEAEHALAVGLSPGKLKRVSHSVPLEQIFRPENSPWQNWFKVFRVHHWVKNLLIFSPILLSHRVQDSVALWQSCVTFLAFSLAASSVYVINDLLDLAADRSHSEKKYRPFASGQVPLGFGLLTAPVLLLGALAIGSSLQAQVDLLLLVYLCLNLAYSLWLKRALFLDVLVLASFYVLRIFIGSVATGIPISPWFMAFSLFLFLSLALVKRVSELSVASAEHSCSTGRSYTPGDRQLLLNFGATSGYLSVLVLALYLNGLFVQSLYLYPSLLWGICPILLFWLSRLWLLAWRGEIHSDPIVFAIKDRTSWVTALLVVVIWCAAWGVLLPW